MSYSEHAVKQRYGRVPEKDIAVGYLKALMAIIGADGEIADGEMDAFQALMDTMGADADIRGAISEFDWKNAKIEDVLPNMKQGGKRARMLLRDAVQIVRADGVYAAEEQAAVAKTAALLGLPAEFVAQVEVLVALEEAATKLKGSLFD